MITIIFGAQGARAGNAGKNSKTQMSRRSRRLASEGTASRQKKTATKCGK